MPGKMARAVVFGILTLLLLVLCNYPAKAEWLIEYRLDSTRPNFLVASGTTWFTGSEFGRSLIGEIDPSRNLTRRFYLANDTELTDLVLGPEFLSPDSSDSSFIWFLQKQAGKAAGLNPMTGETAEWRIPTPNSKPTGIAIHRYGGVFNNTLFFAENETDRIGSLRYFGGQWVFKEFQTPTTNSRPVDVAVDDQGFIWFTESESHKVGKLDP